MSCECMIDNVDDYATLITNQTRKAKKEHQCIECNKKISKGDKYRYEKSLYEGQFETIKTCLTCIEIRCAFFCSWYYGQMFEYLQEKIQGSGLSEKCISELSLEAREVICEMIEESWKE